MARLARYGNVQPSEFEGMDYDEALALDRHVTDLWVEDEKRHAEFQAKLRGA